MYSANFKSKLYILSLPIIFFSINNSSFSSNEDYDSSVAFISESKENIANDLKGKYIKTKIFQSNNFAKSKCLQSLNPQNSAVIAFDMCEFNEDISIEGYLRSQCRRTTQYARSHKIEDLENEDTFHTQTDEADYYITPEIKAVLADPNAINKKDFPMWSFDKNNGVSPFNYKTTSILYWLDIPYMNNKLYSIPYILESKSKNIIKFDADAANVYITINNGDKPFFKGIFLTEKLGYWKELVYFGDEGLIRDAFFTDYDGLNKIQAIRIYKFYSGCEIVSEINEEDLRQKCCVFYRIDVLAFDESHRESDYFDPYKQIKNHHSIVDRIKGIFYRVNEPEKSIPLSSIDTFQGKN